MPNFIKLISQWLFLLTITGTTFAAASPKKLSIDDWQFDVSAYLWAINMNGQVKVGETPIKVNQDFGKIMQQFEAGGMFWASAHKDRWGLFLNSLYAELANKQTLGVDTVKATNQFALFSAGLSYVALRQNLGRVTSANPMVLQLEPYVGARLTLNDTRVKLERTSLALSSNHHWTDPIAGLRLRYIFNPRWQATLAGDVGGTSLSTDSSYDVLGLVGYQPYQHLAFYAGYRFLYQNYQTGQGENAFDWQMHLTGPVAGVAITF